MRGGIEAGGQMKCPRTAGLEYTNKNSGVARVAPFFSEKGGLNYPVLVRFVKVNYGTNTSSC